MVAIVTCLGLVGFKNSDASVCLCGYQPGKLGAFGAARIRFGSRELTALQVRKTDQSRRPRWGGGRTMTRTPIFGLIL